MPKKADTGRRVVGLVALALGFPVAGWVVGRVLGAVLRWRRPRAQSRRTRGPAERWIAA